MLIHLCGISPSRQQAMRGTFFPCRPVGTYLNLKGLTNKITKSMAKFLWIFWFFLTYFKRKCNLMRAIKSIHMNSLTTLVPIMRAVCLTISEQFSTLIDKWNNLPPWLEFSCNKIQKKKSIVTAFKWYRRVIRSQERKLCTVKSRVLTRPVL